MIPVIQRTENKIVGKNSFDETIEVAAEGGKHPIYNSDIGPRPCRLMSVAGIYLVVDYRGRPQVIGQDEMLFILWAIDQLGGGPGQSRRKK